MLNRRGFWMATAIAAALALGNDARAEFCVFNYATAVNAQIGPNYPVVPPAGSVQNTSNVTLLPVPSGPNPPNPNILSFIGKSGQSVDASAPGGANIQFLDVAFQPSGETGLGFRPYDARYTFRITIQDTSAPNQPLQSVTGFGGLGGVYQSDPQGSINDFNPSLFYSFGTPDNPTNSTTLTFASGATYTVTVKNVRSPGSAGPGNPGGLTAVVTCNVVPEPSSVVMMSLGGVGALGLVGLRRRKAKV